MRTGVAVLCALSLACAVTRGWSMDIPKPATAKHPGAAEAPASSPTTYPDEDGFQKRMKRIAEGLAQEDLSKYRRGYFTGGDPGKYTIGPCVARQLLNETDAEAIKYMSDDRTPKERYHFAIVGWARYLPLFGHTLPKPVFDAMCRVDGGALANFGTENHVAMWRTSAVTVSTFRGGKPQGKEWLLDYVRKLYQAGQGEWDSSTYMMFDVNGFLNIYDFSQDEECRLLAKAALDWYATAYALKFCGGMHAGPKQRGHTSGPWESITDQTGWLWWGGASDPGDKVKGFRYAMHAGTSGWRPNRVLCRIAGRELPKIPFEMRNSKPNYWAGLDGPPTPVRSDMGRESLYVTPEFTLGTMWYSEDSCCQLLRLQLGVRTANSVVAFTGSHVGQNDGKDRFCDGQGAINEHEGRRPVTRAIYVQYCQVGSTAVCMAKLPAAERNKYTYFIYPESAGEPVRHGDWHIFPVHRTFVAVRGLTPTVEKDQVPGKVPQPLLKFPGDVTSFVLTVADVNQCADLAAFQRALDASALDASGFAANMRVSLKTLDGRAVAMTYREGQKQPAVSVDGQDVNYDGWPVYDGLYVKQKDGVLSVNDGQEGFVIDFSADKKLPEYRAWKP